MKLQDLLLYQLRQLQQSVEELKDTKNIRDKAARLAEIRAQHRLLDSTLEKLENEQFRRDPKTLLHRSFLCYNPEKKTDTDKE